MDISTFSYMPLVIHTYIIDEETNHKAKYIDISYCFNAPVSAV